MSRASSLEVVGRARLKRCTVRLLKIRSLSASNAAVRSGSCIVTMRLATPPRTELETEVPGSDRSSERVPCGRRLAHKAAPGGESHYGHAPANRHDFQNRMGSFWSFWSSHAPLRVAVTAPLLVEQDCRLVEALLQILFTVLQRFHTPLQQEIALLQARCSRIRRRGGNLFRFCWRDSFAVRQSCERSSSNSRSCSDSCSEGPVLREQGCFSLGVMRFDQLIELFGPALYLDPVADAAVP